MIIDLVIKAKLNKRFLILTSLYWFINLGKVEVPCPLPGKIDKR